MRCGPTLTPVPATREGAELIIASQTLATKRRGPAAWARPGFRARLGLIVLLLLGLLPVLPGFYHFIQARPGQRLPDPLAALLPVGDVSTPTFLLIYGSVAATLVFLLPRPYLLLRALWAYYFLQLLRMLTLWLVPLEPPALLLVLHDPVMDQLFEATTQPITRDLFFSGHTATMALVVLMGRGRRWRRIWTPVAVAVAVLVLVQRAHYSYDVLAAPFFAWGAYWLAGQVAWRSPGSRLATNIFRRYRPQSSPPSPSAQRR